MIFLGNWDSLNTAIKVLSIIGIVLVCIYLVYAIIVSIEVHKFRKRIRKKMNCLLILAVEERRLIIESNNLFQNLNKPINPKYDAQFRSILKISITKVSYKDISAVFAEFRDYRKVFSKSLNSSELDSNKVATSLRGDFSDLDYEKRKLITSYNSDVDGLNYWLNLVITKWIYFLLRIRKYRKLN